jgi:hypothetical protein
LSPCSTPPSQPCAASWVLLNSASSSPDAHADTDYVGALPSCLGVCSVADSLSAKRRTTCPLRVLIRRRTCSNTPETTHASLSSDCHALAAALLMLPSHCHAFSRFPLFPSQSLLFVFLFLIIQPPPHASKSSPVGSAALGFPSLTPPRFSSVHRHHAYQIDDGLYRS